MKQPKFITHPSYDQLHNAAVTMAEEVMSMGRVECVVALLKGGCFFGLVASSKLKVPLYTIDYSSTKGKGTGSYHSNDLIEIPHKHIWIVDDLADSGNSMKEVSEHYSKQHELFTSVFHYKESSSFRPDLYWWRIPSDSEWIVYPHEV
jgi:hypoxanthine phosphoribosyltransferase